MKRAKNEGRKGGQEEGKTVEREGGKVGGKVGGKRVHAGKVELLEPTGSLATMPFSV